MTHRFACKVYYEDTDMGGIVYYANYLKFIERARSEWVAALGLDQNAIKEAGLVFAVRRVEADYLAPARLGDALEVVTTTQSTSTARWVLDQEVRRGETLLFQAQVTLVAIDLKGRPQRLPAELRQHLTPT